MCGIAGYYGSKEISQARIDECLALMRRRGPDSAAYKVLHTSSGRQATLLHSRLSIIDLDGRANQPFAAGDKTIIFNGEIYNYLEMKRELSTQGHRFKTSSDTEVLLKAIDHYGWAALDLAEGMWAFAVFDTATGALTLSRDRFGEKPLFIYQDATGTYFGSEIKFIFALLGQRLPVDDDHLKRYLVNGYKALYKKPHTFFKNLQELPAGTTLTLNTSGRATSQRYWTPQYHQEESMSYTHAVAQAREKLLRAVEIRLRADVPMAFCMSGGVDSNSLISIAKNVFNYDVHGFTIGNEDKRYEESELIEQSVRELGIRHTTVPLTTDHFLENLRTLIRQHDAPVYTITYYTHWVLMKHINAHGYRISVSGTAADELFSGYYDHHLAYLYQVRQQPALHAAAKEAWQTHIAPIVRNPHLGNPDLFIHQQGFRDHLYLDAQLFSDRLTRPWQEVFTEEPLSGDLLRNRMLNEVFHENVPVILHEDDLNSMYYSIENRSPFLDRPLFEFCQKIPSAHLIQSGRAKAVLRDAMRGIAPQAVLDSRRKVGFNAPIHSLLNTQDAGVRQELMKDSPIFDIVKRKSIEDIIGSDIAGVTNSESKFLFNFVSAKLFLEEFAA